MEHIRSIITGSVAVKQQILADDSLMERIVKVIGVVAGCLKEGGKVLFCGNGGSAADAQHLAAELSGRFYYDRPPLQADALHVNTSYLTAVANDYSYDEIYARLIRGQGRRGDVLVGLSTSGNSPNVLRAFEAANQLCMISVAMTGSTGGKLAPMADWLLNVPSDDTPRIQEAHIMIGHIICEMVEKQLFPKNIDS